MASKTHTRLLLTTPEVHHRLKVYCVINKLDIQQKVTQILQEWLEQNEEK